MKTAVAVLTFMTLLSAASFGSIACPNGTYDTYLGPVNAAGGCSIASAIFSNFTYSATAAGGGIVIPASSVSVTPVSSPELGFIFTLPLSAGVNQGADAALGYSGRNTLGFNGASLFQTGLGAGSGTAAASDTLCLGGSLIGGCQRGTAVTLQTFTGAGFSQPTDHIAFATVTSIDVSKDVGANSNGAGTANISVVGNTLSVPNAVPEPITSLLMGGGLLALGIFGRKTRA